MISNASKPSQLKVIIDKLNLTGKNFVYQVSLSYCVRKTDKLKQKLICGLRAAFIYEKSEIFNLIRKQQNVLQSNLFETIIN